MRSTFGGFNTIVRGISANQTGIDTTGHNITNANTDGYSRQNVNLVTTDPQTIYNENGTFQIGTGVSVDSITRARDTLLDKQYWKETSIYTYNQTAEELLGKIESIFGEPSDTGVQTVLNNFWNSWQTLGANASDDGSRTAVREKGVALVNSIKASVKQLKNMVADINDEIEKQVNTVNQYTDEIAQLNKKIFATEASGADHANDLRDRRDYLCDQLATIIDTTVTEDSRGNYIVQTGTGYVLADCSSSTRLDIAEFTDEDYGYIKDKVKIAGSVPQQIIEFRSGKVKSLIDLRDAESGGIKGYLNNLSNISQFLLQDFNEVHRSGYGSDNSTGNNFFGIAKNNYSSDIITGNYTKDKWIDELRVNSALFESGGTALIAAKTSGASIGTTKPRSEDSDLTVFATKSAGGSGYTNGTTPTPIQVRIKTVFTLPSGQNYPNDIEYSLDGTTWTTVSPTTAVSATNPPHYTLNNINGLDVDMYFERSGNNVVGDTFTYSLTNNSADSNFNVTKKTLSTAYGEGSIVAASGRYEDGDNATQVIVQPLTFDTATNASANPPTVIGKVRTIRYSIDGGKSWTSASVDDTTKGTQNSTFSLSVKNVKLTMQIATDTNNSTSGEYYFTVSKGNVGSGDNAVLLSKRLKNDTSNTLGQMSLDGYYSSVIGALGVQREDAQRAETNQKTLLTQIDNMRQAVSGVSLDEEMTKMIQYQKGYNAAARMLTTMNDMLDTLLSSVR